MPRAASRPSPSAGPFRNFSACCFAQRELHRAGMGSLLQRRFVDEGAARATSSFVPRGPSLSPTPANVAGSWVPLGWTNDALIPQRDHNVAAASLSHDTHASRGDSGVAAEEFSAVAGASVGRD